MRIRTALFTTLKALVGLAVLGVIVAWMSGAFRSKTAPGKAEAPARMVADDAKTAVIRSVVEPVFEESVGTVSARRRMVVSSKIMAAIEEIHVRAGDRVAEGDLLVALDSRDLEARVRQAIQARRAAAAVLERAEADFKRNEKLYASQTIGRSDFDAAKAAREVAKAEAERAGRAVEEAEVALSYARIIAPAPGRVVDRLADPGDLATPGRPLLNIYDPSALRLEAPVRESLAPSLKVGSEVEVHIDATGATLNGKVEEIVPQSQAGARSFLVKVALPQSQGLFSGMFGRLRIPVGERGRLLVKDSALERIGQLEYVVVVDEKRHGSRRLITTGQLGEDGLVEILSGLREGESVLAP